MTVRSLIAASIATTTALAGIAAIARSRLPANTRLPVHWGASGAANGFADAPVALFMPVVLCAGISVTMAVLPHLEPLQNRLDGSKGLFRTSWAALLALCAVLEAQVAAPAFGVILPVSLPLVATGLLLIVLGNALPKSRPGFFVGIRTPWTLSDPDNWVATHRLGARTMIAGGAIIVAAALLPIAPATRETCVVAALIVAVVPPVVYSFAYWRRGRAA
jgi:uncharacterized membrane protein